MQLLHIPGRTLNRQTEGRATTGKPSAFAILVTLQEELSTQETFRLRRDYD
jgi:hypothetical protein